MPNITLLGVRKDLLEKTQSFIPELESIRDLLDILIDSDSEVDSSREDQQQLSELRRTLSMFNLSLVTKMQLSVATNSLQGKHLH